MPPLPSPFSAANRYAYKTRKYITSRCVGRMLRSLHRLTARPRRISKCERVTQTRIRFDEEERIKNCNWKRGVRGVERESIFANGISRHTLLSVHIYFIKTNRLLSSRRFLHFLFLFTNIFYFYFHSPKVTCQINLIFIVNIRFVLYGIEMRRIARRCAIHTQSSSCTVCAFFPSPSACFPYQMQPHRVCTTCADLLSIDRLFYCLFEFSLSFSLSLFSFNSQYTYIYFLSWIWRIYIVFFHLMFVVVS